MSTDDFRKNQTLLWIVGRIAAFLFRHAVAVAGVVLAGLLLWTFVYFALLLWALIVGGGIGGPLAYPAGLLVVLGMSLSASLALLFPATAIAERLGKRLRWPVLAQIPLSVGVAGAICVSISLLSMPGEFAKGLQTAAILWAANLLPLGLYWWIAQSGPLILSGIDRWKSRLRAVF